MVRYATDAIDLLGSRDAVALPAVPWKQVIGMRNILIHGYNELDLGTVVQTVQEHLAQMIAAIRQFLGDDPK